jgi:hypothetical protein
MAKVTLDGEPQKQRIVCVEKGAIADRGEPLYDREGKPLPAWTTLEKLIFDYENDLMRSEELCRLMAGMKLLEPFTMKAEVDGFTMQLEGMHRIARSALDGLPEPELRKLMTTGMMDKVYAHLMSLDNFRRLLNRRSFFANKTPASQEQLN